MKKEKFPLSYIKDDNSVLFWSAFLRIQMARNSGIEVPEEWYDFMFCCTNLLDTAIAENKLLREEYDLSEIMEALTDFFEEESFFDEKFKESLFQFCMVAINQQVQHVTSVAVHKDQSKATRDIIYSIINYSHVLELFRDKTMRVSDIPVEFQSDKAFRKEMFEVSKNDVFSIQKSKYIRTIYNLSFDQFPHDSKYLRCLITGVFCGLMDLLDSEESHATSDRFSTYKEYLINNVKQYVKDLK